MSPLPDGLPPPAPRPMLARLLSPPGPAQARLFRHGNDAVLAIPGRYCVTYLLVGPGGVVAVDCGSGDDLERVRTGLAWLGLGADSVRYVMPSHLHFDHVMGIDRLARAFEVPVGLGPIAAEHVRARRPLRFPDRLRALRALPTWPMQGMPVFTPRDWRRGMEFGFPWSRNRFRAPLLELPGDGEPLPALEGWTVLETPGHADDALCLHHAEAGWLVSGDTVRNFLGGEWNPLQCDPAAYARSQARLEALEVTTVLPGHGPAFTVPAGLSGMAPRPWWQP